MPASLGLRGGGASTGDARHRVCDPLSIRHSSTSSPARVAMSQANYARNERADDAPPRAEARSPARALFGGGRPARSSSSGSVAVIGRITLSLFPSGAHRGRLGCPHKRGPAIIPIGTPFLSLPPERGKIDVALRQPLAVHYEAPDGADIVIVELDTGRCSRACARVSAGFRAREALQRRRAPRNIA